MLERPRAQGHCDDKFRGLRQRLEYMLANGQEVGCAVAVFLDGRLAVDLWAGWTDPARGQPWHRDTIVSTFSVTKALVATMGHMLVDRGLVDLDQPVARYWPTPTRALRSATPPT
jgi:CubicO group peptidase (beta-lactamase class C family)